MHRVFSNLRRTRVFATCVRGVHRRPGQTGLGQQRCFFSMKEVVPVSQHNESYANIEASTGVIRNLPMIVKSDASDRKEITVLPEEFLGPAPLLPMLGTFGLNTAAFVATAILAPDLTHSHPFLIGGLAASLTAAFVLEKYPVARFASWLSCNAVFGGFLSNTITSISVLSMTSYLGITLSTIHLLALYGPKCKRLSTIIKLGTVTTMSVGSALDLAILPAILFPVVVGMSAYDMIYTIQSYRARKVDFIESASRLSSNLMCFSVPYFIM